MSATCRRLFEIGFRVQGIGFRVYRRSNGTLIFGNSQCGLVLSSFSSFPLYCWAWFSVFKFGFIHSLRV